MHFVLKNRGFHRMRKKKPKKVDGSESFRYIKAEIIVILGGARHHETILFIFNEISTTKGN